MASLKPKQKTIYNEGKSYLYHVIHIRYYKILFLTVDLRFAAVEWVNERNMFNVIPLKDFEVLDQDSQDYKIDNIYKVRFYGKNIQLDYV